MHLIMILGIIFIISPLIISLMYYIKYKLVVKNETDKDYYVIEETNFTNSNYLSYKFPLN